MSTKKSAWQECELKDIFTIVTGKTPSKKIDNYFGGNIPFVKPPDLDKNLFIDLTEDTLTENGFQKSVQLPKNTVLVSCIGNLGKKGILLREGSCNQQINAILPNKIIYYKYTYYYINIIKEWMEINSSATTVKILNKSTFEKAPFKYPPLEEQKLIVEKIESEFQKIDEALTKLNIIKEQIKQYKQSVLKYAFDENNSFAKGSNYEPYEWEEKILNDIIDKSKNAIKRGPFGSSLKKEFFVENGIRVFEQYNPINNDPYWCRYRITKEKYEELKEFKCKEGDFLISCSGVSLGRIVELPNGVEEGIINQALLKITIDKNIINNKYFILLFRSPEFQNKILGNARGAAIQNIASVKELKNIKIKLPNIELQKNIADNIQNIFDKVDNIENNINENIDKLNVLKQAVLKKAFEGKLI